jgi:hypothetical protein
MRAYPIIPMAVFGGSFPTTVSREGPLEDALLLVISMAKCVTVVTSPFVDLCGTMGDTLIQLSMGFPEEELVFKENFLWSPLLEAIMHSASSIFSPESKILENGAPRTVFGEASERRRKARLA